LIYHASPLAMEGHRSLTANLSGVVIASAVTYILGRGLAQLREAEGRRRALEARLEHQARHDSLTDLPNRALFHDELANAVSGAAGGRQIAVLFIDLDDFKTVNDRYGHPAGDRLVLGVARRLLSVIRATDVAARLGGDEFALLLRDIGSTADPIRVATRLLQTLAEPFEIDGHQLSARASIGIAIGTGAVSADDLLRQADIAMYAAKADGKCRFTVFGPDLARDLGEPSDIERELGRALEHEELYLVYQPVVDLASGRALGAEALLRWKHPSRNITPLEFIPAAERTGLIVPIGRWVLREACVRARGWQRQIGGRFSISVNVSARQLINTDLPAFVREALDASGLDPRDLWLEVTETVLLNDAPIVTARLEELRALGVRIALDDFGAGYNSLEYVRRFPLDGLKIDASFVRNLPQARTDGILVRALVTLAQGLGVHLVAEGVEREEQARALREAGCPLAQGFLFARPVPADELGRLLERTAAPTSRVVDAAWRRRPLPSDA
ncbi:MAG TPA: EAL domain-containing protein, partial [Candidatus Limnocylindria bacterium]|nr:EAL domain-containing protein [Candidatus Limnocylindria bacterium]